jgi:hypothetical protein
MDNPVIDPSGTKFWYLDGKLHRTDGPACEWVSGRKSWWIDGRRHRTDGAAIEYEDGHKTWWLDGYSYTFDKWLEGNTALTDDEKVMYKLQYG